MQVGDIIPVQCAVPDERTQAMRTLTRRAQVVYIHPKHRFYTVRFESGVKESFAFERRVGEDRPTKRGFHQGNRSRKY